MSFLSAPGFLDDFLASLIIFRQACLHVVLLWVPEYWPVRPKNMSVGRQQKRTSANNLLICSMLKNKIRSTLVISGFWSLKFQSMLVLVQEGLMLMSLG